MSVISYQPHIDGLRAIAVLSILVFHVESTYLPGGFLGVDVFFVISGFLITSIIYRKKEAGTFSFVDFYVRRAKRILPPLFLVLFLVLLVGYFVFLPYDFYKLGISSLCVISFIANIQFSLRTGDYFSNDSAEWPLLHTWSLSVEEQYYFIFPLLLFFLMRKAAAKLVASLLLLVVLSTFLAEAMSRTSGLETYSYYLIFTRMGELLVRSLLAVSQAKKVIKENTSSLLSIFALFGLIAMLFLIDETTVFPGFSALLLCSLTAVLINSRNTAAAFDLSPKNNTMTLMRFPINWRQWRSQNEETLQRRTNHQGHQAA